MANFIKIGGLYVRPDDVLLFTTHPGNTQKSKVFFKDGGEWTINMKAEDIASLLNAEPT